MIWKIAKKEFLLNLMTFKFAVGTILCVVLMVVFMPVLINDYQRQLKDYNANVAANEAELRKVKVYKNITPTIYRPPSVLSVFSEGLEKRLGNSAKITLDEVPLLNAAAFSGNPYQSIFPLFDASLIFRIIISVLALLIAHDVISGEREIGTLKLTLSAAVPRHQVLMGKFLAGLITLAVPVTITFIVALVILLSFPMLQLTGPDWIRIGLMYFASLIFISAMYNIGLLLSCLTRRASISLVMGLFVWILFIMVIPNGSVHLAKKIFPLESEEKFQSKLVEAREKRDLEINQIKQKAPRSWSGSNVREAFGGTYIVVCDDQGRENVKKHHILLEPIKIKHANRLMEIKKNHLNDLFKQKNLADNISRASVISLYENIMSTLAGTNLASAQYYIKNIRQHRNKAIEYIRSKTGNFSSLTYFTRYKEGDWKEYNKAFRNGDHAAVIKWQEKIMAETQPLNLEDYPQFVCQLDIMKTFKTSIPELGILLFINVLFFVLSFIVFLKYDVRTD